MKVTDFSKLQGNTLVLYKEILLNIEEMNVLNYLKNNGCKSFESVSLPNVNKELDIYWDLQDLGLVEKDYTVWHLTYRLSEFGKKILAMNLSLTESFASQAK